MLSTSRIWLVALFPLILIPLYRRRYTARPFATHIELPTDVVSLTRALVAIPSVTGNEQQVFAYAASWLHSHNFSLQHQAVHPLQPGLPPRSNLIALHPDAQISDVHLLLTTHLDTVPGIVDPGKEQDASHPSFAERIYGRGSVDAKSQAAAMMLSLVRLRDVRVALLLVCGEESDHAGMLQAHEAGFGPISLINAEPTESKIAIRQKGIVRARLSVSGKAAHSGYPHLGDSAIHKLLDVLQKMRADTCGDGITLNVGTISGGTAPNVIADSAEAVLMWRITSSARATLDKANAIVESYNATVLEVIKMNDAMEFFVPPIAEEIGSIIVAYNTDVPYYKGELGRAVLFGAGSIAQAHTMDEFVEKEQLKKLPALYDRIARYLIEGGPQN